VVAAYFTLLSQCLTGWNEENQEKPELRWPVSRKRIKSGTWVVQISCFTYRASVLGYRI